MNDLRAQQEPIDRAICDAMVASVPPTWNSILLTLAGSSDRVAGSLEHSLTSPEGYPPAFPTDDLYAATRRLDELIQARGSLFVKATYLVEFLEDSWSYRANFEYSEPAA